MVECHRRDAKHPDEQSLQRDSQTHHEQIEFLSGHTTPASITDRIVICYRIVIIIASHDLELS
jgi:hypothetical protein